MRFWRVAVFICAGVSVVMAALGSHALAVKGENVPDIDLAQLLANWRLAGHYLSLHSVASLVLLQLAEKHSFYCHAAIILLIGSLIFASSLWLNALALIDGWPFSQFTVFTPVGGSLMIVGWFYAAMRSMRAA
ncbi:MAG: DUF423 domain-containing protein [bacterium]